MQRKPFVNISNPRGRQRTDASSRQAGFSHLMVTCGTKNPSMFSYVSFDFRAFLERNETWFRFLLLPSGLSAWIGSTAGSLALYHLAKGHTFENVPCWFARAYEFLYNTRHVTLFAHARAKHYLRYLYGKHKYVIPI